ncbi:MAG TPA: rod shape-determining protein MreD [Chitinophagales bacterium]|nr:rod shape-determining protein MreD [Chitinophagales bacterium]HRK28003.1 rod shape-determining protein MreD [Chitinophagales bacterium]
MKENLYTSVFRLVMLLLFQVFLLNFIKLYGVVTPYIYPLGILLLPFETPRWLLMVLAFFAGLTIDMFTDTPGFHASAMVIMAFARQYVVSVNRPVGDYEPSHKPTIGSLGFYWFIFYAGILVALHHFCFYFIEVYSFHYIPITLLKVGAGSLASLMLMLLHEFLFYKR